MINRLLHRFIAFILCLFVLGCQNPENKPDGARAVNIADGDTFTLLYPDNHREKVRLYGVDSPERSQAYGTAARIALGEMLEGHFVIVKEMDKDRYGRMVAIAYLDDGTCINEALLQQGFAWHFTAYDKNPDWSKMEKEARAQKRGLWADKNPTPPWQYRKEKRQNANAN